MPQVPRYQRQVNEQGLPQNRVETQAPLASFGGGEAVANVYDQAQKLALEAQDRIDQTAAIETNTALIKARTDIMKEVSNFKGKNAAEAAKVAQERWAKVNEEIGGSLSARQRQKFGSLFANQWNDIYQDTEKYVNSELKNWQKVTNVAGKKALEVDAINNYMSPDGSIDESRIQKAISGMNMITEKEAADNGFSPDDEVVKLDKLENSTKVLSGIIDNQLSTGNDISAKKLFDKYKGHIDQDAAKGLVGRIEAGSSRAIGVKLADELINTPGMTERKALKELEKEENTDVRLMAESRIRTMYNDREQQKQVRQSDLLTSGSNILASNGYDMADPRVVQIMSQLPISGKEAMQRFANDRGHKVDDIEASQALEDRLYDPADAVTDAEILEAPISQSTKQKYLDLNREKKAGSDKYNKMTGEYGADASIIRTTLDASGIKNKKMRANFEKAYRDEIQAEKDLSGKKGVTREEKAKIASGLILKQNVEWRVDPYRFNVGIDDIPEADYKEIEQGLIARRAKVTPEAILKIYREANSAE